MGESRVFIGAAEGLASGVCVIQRGECRVPTSGHLYVKVASEFRKFRLVREKKQEISAAAVSVTAYIS